MDNNNSGNFEDDDFSFSGIVREHHRVGGIDFSDLYVGPLHCWMSGVTGSEVDPVPVEYIYNMEMGTIRQICVDMEKKTMLSDFSIKHDDICYRVSVMPSMDGDVYVLRRFPQFVPDLHKLGIHQGVMDKLLEKKLTGMILIAGPTGSGKTTTASALIKRRLLEYGGVAVTAEDPPEMPLQGTHSKDGGQKGSLFPVGVCYQTTVTQGDDGYAIAAKKMLRWKPNIIFLGEIRNGAAAVEALRASINGHLVITTVHSDNVITAISRLNAMAEEYSQGSSAMLADGLIAVLHQKLEGEPKKLKIEFLSLKNEESVGAIKMIRDKRFEMLNTEINLQASRMAFNSNRMNSLNSGTNNG